MRTSTVVATALGMGALICGVLAACVGSDPDNAAPASDPDSAAPDVEQPSDSAIADAGSEATTDSGSGPRCDKTKPFGAKKELQGVNGEGSNRGARLTPDEKTVYFSSAGRDGGIGSYDTWVATRSSPDAGFGTPLLLNGDNTIADEEVPTVSADELVIFTGRFPGGNWNIYSASRATKNDTFGTFILSSVSDGGTANEEIPYVLPDKSALYFESDVTGTREIYRSPIVGGTLQAPVKVLGITSAGNNAVYSWVSQSELAIYFSSDRAGSVNLDIYVARRTTTGSAFGQPQAVQELNTAGMDEVTWLSEDECVVVWNSNIDPSDASTTQKVYYAQRPK